MRISVAFFRLLCAMVIMPALAQQESSVIEKPVDEDEYQRILEYYSYDAGMPSDPEFYGEWPWRGPHVLRGVTTVPPS